MTRVPRHLAAPRIAAPLAAILLALALAAPPAPAADTLELPRDVRALLPTAADAILVVPSLEDLEREWPRLFCEGETPCDTCGLRGVLNTFLPGMDEHADLDAPFALTLRLDPTSKGMPYLPTLIVRLRDPDDREGFLDGIYGASRTSGDHVAWSLDPEYAPAADLPAYARDLPPGRISVRVDLVSAMEVVRPLVEMGLAQLAWQADLERREQTTGEEGIAPPDRDGDRDGRETRPHPPRPTPEAVEAIGAITRGLMDAFRICELSLDRRGDRNVLRSGVEVAPGCPFDLGPQPSFDEALDLSRFLERGNYATAAWALDPAPLVDALLEPYLTLMAIGMRDAPPGLVETQLALVERALASGYVSLPGAASIDLEDGRLAGQMIYRTDEPDRVLDELLALYDGMAGMELGAWCERTGEIETEGVLLRQYELVYDVERMAAARGDQDTSPAGVAELMMMQAFMDDLVPTMSLGALEGHVILVMDDDPEAARGLIVRIRKGRDGPDRGLARLAERGDHGLRSVAEADLAVMLRFLTDVVRRLDPGSTVHVPPELLDRSLPVGMAAGLEGTRWWSVLECDPETLVEVFEALGEIREIGED